MAEKDPGPLLAGRKAPRYAITAASGAVEPLTRKLAIGCTTVISATGCYLRTDDRFSVGSLLDLRIEWQGETFESRALVAHASAQGMGLGFFDVQEPYAATLKRFLHALEVVSAGRQAARPTAREIQIIQLLAQGKGNKEIAHELGLSVRTVETHRAHVMRKLRVRSLIQLVYYAMDHGIAPQRKGPIVASTPSQERKA